MCFLSGPCPIDALPDVHLDCPRDRETGSAALTLPATPVQIGGDLRLRIFSGDNSVFPFLCLPQDEGRKLQKITC